MTTAAPGQPVVKTLFLFNHRFEANLPLLDRIYGPRFSRRHTIMPFASSPGPTRSRVAELGRNFSGHFAQSAHDWIEPEVTHYVVIPDDLLLNPALDESNLIAALRLKPGEAYTKNLIAADALRFAWPWAGEAAATFEQSAKAIDLHPLLPPAAEARARFESMGLAFPTPAVLGGRANAGTHVRMIRNAKRAYLHAWSLRTRPAAFPLLAGYSDFLVIPAEAIDQFVHYCGVFAALNVFAEVAVPTALALAAEHVRTELALNTHFLDPGPPLRDPAALRGIELWNPADMAAHSQLFAGDLDHLFAQFPKEWLYVHPVKLSAYR
ncbi:MAG: hypothetical protein JF593_13585 [Novosphingobium sp.]|nr:hypothetical protein [Novosphingobium sp.]